MSAWYYSQADQIVGPFQREVLGKLVHAGVIDDTTLVRQTDEEEWLPLATALVHETSVPLTPDPGEARYYYLDANNQPVGPFDVASLKCLRGEKVIAQETLVSGAGDTEWVPAAEILGLAPAFPPILFTPPAEAEVGIHPRCLPLERYIFLTVVTLGLYPFYLVPCQSRDLKAITGRERMEFTALLILGVVTLSLVLLVMQVLWAYDLERHGKAISKLGRREALGTIVFVMTVLAVVLSFAIDGFVVSYVVATLFGASALWLLQKEINLYAVAPDPAPN